MFVGDCYSLSVCLSKKKLAFLELLDKQNGEKGLTHTATTLIKQNYVTSASLSKCKDTMDKCRRREKEIEREKV